MSGEEKLKIGIAQISPVWMNKSKTIVKVLKLMDKAKLEGCDIVAFGEALIPGKKILTGYCRIRIIC